MSNEEYIRAHLSPEREREVDPFVITTFMPIEPYDDVADIGCGPGYFSIPLAKHLVYGKLYALDVSDEMLDVTFGGGPPRPGWEMWRSSSAAPTDLPLPEGSLDGAFSGVRGAP